MLNNPKVVIVNAAKMNYDELLDFSVCSEDTAVYANSTTEEFLERIKDADAVVTKEYPVTKELFAGFPDSVKLLVEAGTGYNNIDLAAAREHGITVCNIPAYSSERVAQTAIMFMLNLASTMQVQLRMLERGDRRNFHEHLLVPHVELNGKTLGLIGCGGIGSETAKIAHAMGMNILIYKRHPGEDSDGIHYTDLETLLKNSDFVSLHCPLNAETRHMIGSEQLAMMKKSAFIINTARGALIDEQALIEALQKGIIAGAGLDVQETEPPVDDNPLYDMENVIMTPHMGWKGLETRQRLVSIIAEDIHSYFAGNPVNVVS